MNVEEFDKLSLIEQLATINDDIQDTYGKVLDANDIVRINNDVDLSNYSLKTNATRLYDRLAAVRTNLVRLLTDGGIAADETETICQLIAKIGYIGEPPGKEVWSVDLSLYKFTDEELGAGEKHPRLRLYGYMAHAGRRKNPPNGRQLDRLQLRHLYQYGERQRLRAPHPYAPHQDGLPPWKGHPERGGVIVRAVPGKYRHLRRKNRRSVPRAFQIQLQPPRVPRATGRKSARTSPRGQCNATA